MTIPGWLPNWKDETEYPAPDQRTSMVQWAWEFLRRNPQYQSDFERSQTLNREFTQSADSIEYRRLCSLYKLGAMVNPASPFGKDVAESLAFETINTPAVGCATHDDYLGFVASRSDPLDLEHSRPGNITPEHFANAVLPRNPKDLIIKVNLSKPLEWLLAQVEDVVRNQWDLHNWENAKGVVWADAGSEDFKRKQRGQPIVYCRCLRVLDGLQREVSLNSMAKVICEDQVDPDRAIKHLRRLAERLRDRDYAELAILQSREGEESLDDLLSYMQQGE